MTGERQKDGLDLFGTLFQAHPWHGVPAMSAAGGVNAYIEIVPSDTVKYELDKAAGHLRLDRPQRFSSQCPTLYGFIPQTYCGDEIARLSAAHAGRAVSEGDGDPLDICVLTERVVSHGGFLLRARPIGGLRMIDGSQADDKIVAVLEDDLAFGNFRDVGDCPGGVIDRLKHYFLSYKREPDEDTARVVQITSVYDAAEARAVIAASRADYVAKFGDPAARLRALLQSS